MHPGAAGNGDEPWLTMLKEPLPLAADIASVVERFSVVPEASRGHVAAALGVMSKGYNMPARTAQILQLVISVTTLKSAINSMDSLCPPAQKAALFANLGKMAAHLEEKHGTGVSDLQVQVILTSLAPLLVKLAASPAVDWPTLSGKLQPMPAVPIRLIGAFGSVVGEASLRKALYELVTTSPPPKASAWEEIKALMLKATKGKEEAASWFMTEGATSGSSGSTTGSLHGALVPCVPGSAVSAGVLQPSSSVMQPVTGFLPMVAPAGDRVAVKMTGLQRATPETGSTALTAHLGTPIYVTASDVKRGYGFATIPRAMYDSLFSRRKRQQKGRSRM